MQVAAKLKNARISPQKVRLIADMVRGARQHAHVAVLTNKPLRPSERVLEGLGLSDLVDEVIGGDGPFPRKPDPAGLRALIERAGVTPVRRSWCREAR